MYKFFQNHDPECPFTIAHNDTPTGAETFIALTDLPEKAHLITTALNTYREPHHQIDDEIRLSDNREAIRIKVPGNSLPRQFSSWYEFYAVAVKHAHPKIINDPDMNPLVVIELMLSTEERIMMRQIIPGFFCFYQEWKLGDIKSRALDSIEEALPNRDDLNNALKTAQSILNSDPEAFAPLKKLFQLCKNPHES